MNKIRAAVTRDGIGRRYDTTNVVIRQSPFSRMRCRASARCGLRWFEMAVIVEENKEGDMFVLDQPATILSPILA